MGTGFHGGFGKTYGVKGETQCLLIHLGMSDTVKRKPWDIC